jgi:hypothetical protein
MGTVILSVGKRATLMLDYPHGNAGIGKHLFRIFVLWRAPPFNDMRPSSPMPQQGDVGFGNRTKAVSEHPELLTIGVPPAKLLSVTNVRLRPIADIRYCSFGIADAGELSPLTSALSWRLSKRRASTVTAGAS